MSFTFVSKAGNNDDSGTTNTLGVTLISVASGSLIAIAFSFEGATTTATCSDGTSSLTQWVPGVTAGARGSEPWLVGFYLLAAVATGSVTYTVTLGANRPFKQIAGMCYTPSAAASTDGTPAAASGSTTPISSGNMTTTGTDGLAFGLYAEFGQATTSETINGVAEDQFQMANSAAGRHSAIWSKTYSSGFTGAAAGTLGANELYTLGIMAFNIGGGGAAYNAVPVLEYYQQLRRGVFH